MVAQTVETTEKVYRARKGSRFSDADAAIIGPFIEQLTKEQGADTQGVTPETIVAAARSKKSPIHRYFEWDTSQAAEQYRLWQARNLAKSWRVEIVYHEQEGQRVFQVPGMVSVKITSSKREYIPYAVARENADYLAQLAEDAKQRLIYWKTRFAAYRSEPAFIKLQPVFALLDTLDSTPV